MKIQKKYQGAIPLNRIANEYNQSTTNTYSTSYINDNLFNKKEIYSDIERVIGVWINNKPLYQKTMIITLGDGITSNQFNLNIPDIDYIYIDSGNSSIQFKNMSFVQLGFYAGETDYSRAYIDGGKAVGGIVLGSAYASGEKTVYLTLKYTKTTD